METGCSMKRYGNIYEKIGDMDNLREAHRNARKDKLFYAEVVMVDSDPDKYLSEIREMLINHTYSVNLDDYTISTINDKGKQRELWKLPYFPHRIIQWAIMLQIEPIFNKVFTGFTCASLPNRGIKKAQELVNTYLKDEPGTQYCFKMDVHHFYPSINHRILKRLLRKKFKDPELLALLDIIIDSHPPKGVPIGSYLPQYLANFYLSYFDHWLKEKLHLKYVVRYMDDLLIFHHSKQVLHWVARKIMEYLEKFLDLTLKKNWQVFPTSTRGADFVGYRFFHGFTLLRKKTCKRFKKHMVAIREKWEAGKRICYKEWCRINSYKGWLKWCDSFRLAEKYVNPVLAAADDYYFNVIKKRKAVTV